MSFKADKSRLDFKFCSENTCIKKVSNIGQIFAKRDDKVLGDSRIIKILMQNIILFKFNLNFTK